VEQGDKIFRSSGQPRPQEANVNLLKRLRQVNFLDLKIGNTASQKKFDVTETMLKPKGRNTCYPSGGPKPARWIMTEADFFNFMSQLETCSEMALDLEYHNYRSLSGKTMFINIKFIFKFIRSLFISVN